MTYATVSDVATLLARTLTAAEEAKATALLPIADAKILLAVPSVPDRITAGTLDVVLVTHVAASLVARALTTTDGVTATEEQIDDYRRVERRDTAQIEGGFDLTAGEIDLLQPTTTDATAVDAFTIKPYRAPRQRAVDCA